MRTSKPRAVGKFILKCIHKSRSKEGIYAYTDTTGFLHIVKLENGNDEQIKKFVDEILIEAALK
mgnify:CR=1 FL=1